jgi:cell fate (sporulation/competence/biofilm development) regulator YlbF (YheA/YmcA/DUF963 family)
MLATIEGVFILDKAEEISNMILHSDTAEEYFQCIYKLRNSHETQQKIRQFVKVKEQYEEVQRFGKYHPDYHVINKKVREVKREMDLDDNVAAFRRAENELQSLLDEISVIVGHSVSKQIKVPTGNPFFDSSSNCSGGCGSGGSCGCSA